MADIGLTLLTGAASQPGAVRRTVTEVLLDRELLIRAIVRCEDERAPALRAAGAEVVIGDLLQPADVHRVVRGRRQVYFGMSVSPGYLESSVTMAAVAREVGGGRPRQHVPEDGLPDEHPVSIQNTTPGNGSTGSASCANRFGRVVFFPAPVSERLQHVRCIHSRIARGTTLGCSILGRE
jgi:NAD(P)H-binding